MNPLFRANVENYRLHVSAKAPRLIITGQYEVLGNVLVINIRSKGDFQAVFGKFLSLSLPCHSTIISDGHFFFFFPEDASGLAKMQGKEIVKDGVKYMKVDRAAIDFKVGKARFRIRDHSPGNKVLSEAINNFLNQNWKEVLEELKYTVSSALEKYLKQILNTALLKVPLNLFLVDE